MPKQGSTERLPEHEAVHQVFVNPRVLADDFSSNLVGQAIDCTQFGLFRPRIDQYFKVVCVEQIVIVQKAHQLAFGYGQGCIASQASA